MELNMNIVVPNIICAYFLETLSDLKKRISKEWTAPPAIRKKYRNMDDRDMIYFLRYMIETKPSFIAEDGSPFRIEPKFLEPLLKFRHLAAHFNPLIISVEDIKEFRQNLLNLSEIPEFKNLLSIVDSCLLSLNIKDLPIDPLIKVRLSIEEIKRINRDIFPIVSKVEILLNSQISLSARFFKYNGNNTKFYIFSQNEVKSIFNKNFVEIEVASSLIANNIREIDSNKEVYLEDRMVSWLD